MVSDIKCQVFQFHPAQATTPVELESLLNAALSDNEIHSSQIVSITKDDIRGITNYTVFYRPTEHLYYNAYLGSGGETTRTDATANMNVDGSSTPQEFYIHAQTDHDLHLTWVAICIVDGDIDNDKFGDISPLSTGWDLQIRQNGGSYVSIVDKAKTVTDIMFETSMAYPFGEKDDNMNRLDSLAGGDEKFLCQFALKDMMAESGSLSMDANTTDRIRAVVNDDLTGLTEFKVKVFGFRDPV